MKSLVGDQEIFAHLNYLDLWQYNVMWGKTVLLASTEGCLNTARISQNMHGQFFSHLSAFCLLLLPILENRIQVRLHFFYSPPHGDFYLLFIFTSVYNFYICVLPHIHFPLL